MSLLQRLSLSVSGLLSALVVGSLVILSCLMLMLVGVEVRSALDSVQQSALEGEAREIHAEIEGFLDNRLQLLQDHSRLPMLVQGLMQPEENRLLTEDLMAQLSFLGVRYPLTLLDFSGRELQSAPIPPHFDYSDAPWVDQLLEGELASYRGVSEQEGRYFWRLAVPVRYGGLPEGVLVLEIPLVQLVRQLHMYAYLEHAQLAIYRDETALLSTWKTLDEPLRYHMAWPEMGLELRFQLDNLQAKTQRDRLLLKMLLLGLMITLLVALFAAWLGWRLLSRPLSELLGAVRGVAKGQSQPVEVHGSPLLELHHLAQRFNAMVSQVEQREQTLQERNQLLAELNRELKESHAQLVQSEKMSSLGTLAAGVAHEINNPLGYIKSNLQTLVTYQQVLLQWAVRCQAETQLSDQLPALAEELRRLEQEADLEYIIEDCPALLAESLEGAERVQKIVQDLKSFARVDSGELRPVNINEVIASCLRILANELKYHCQVFQELEEVAQVWGSEGQLSQVLMNLVLNAAQAVGDQGRIWLRSYRRDGEVIVEVSDDGPGVNPKLHEQIFNPFFTTKPVGQGTGLGLSISLGIIEKHGGRIELDRSDEGGACFRIRLPVWRKMSAESVPADG